MAISTFVSSFIHLAWFALIFVGFGLVTEHNLPEGLSPGQSYEATWVIDKGTTDGFARFQLILPEGLRAEPLETQGASFTFQNQRAKFIWMDVPPKQTISVSLLIHATPDFQGGVVNQRFSFIEEGTRQDVEFEPHILARLPADFTQASVGNESASQGALTARRSARMEARDVALTTLHIEGFESGNFLKLEEVIPADCTFEWDSDGAPSIQDRFGDTIMAVWHQAPERPFLSISYRITGDIQSHLPAIYGTWSTVIQNAPFTVDMPAMDLNEVTDWTSFPHDASETPLATTDPTLPPTEFIVPEPDEGVAYRVQILAAHRDVNQPYFQETYAFSESVDSEPHDHWIKYTTGSHTRYQAARNARKNINENYHLPGPFVTAYLRGERITVQEALLLTQQNWIP